MGRLSSGQSATAFYTPMRVVLGHLTRPTIVARVVILVSRVVILVLCVVTLVARVLPKIRNSRKSRTIHDS